MWGLTHIRNLFSSRLAAGLDISDRSLEYLVVERGKGDLRVSFRTRLPLAPDVVEHGVIQDRVKLATSVEEIFRTPGAPARPRTLTIGLNERQVFTHHFSLDRALPRSRLGEAVLREAEKSVPVDLTEYVWDFMVTGELPQTYEVLFSAAKKAVSQGYKDLLAGLGVREIILEPESLALARSIIKNSDFERGAVLIIDLGAHASGLYLADEQGLLFSVGLGRGSEEMTKAIVDKFGIPAAEAEVRKLRRGFTDEDLFLILQYVPQLILREAKKLMSFYELEGGRRVAEILLVGGGALIPGLLRYVEGNVDKPVKLVSEKDDILYAVAIGLALRGFDPAHGINFLRK